MSDIKNIIDMSSVIIPIMIINALTLVVALSWNNAIENIIDNYINVGNDNKKKAWYKLYFSIIITVIFVIILIIYSKYINVHPKEFIKNEIL
jgi:uncharacterized membrane protein YkvI